MSAALAAAGFLGIGCSSPPPAFLPPAPSIDPPSGGTTNTAAGERAVVEQVYGEFWQVSWISAGEPDSQWEHDLGNVTADPLLSQILSRARQQRADGIRLYGEVAPHVSEVRVDGDQATITDCQDGSRSGQADLATGHPRNVGPEHNPVRGTLTRGADGAWRVLRIDFPGGGC